MRGTLLVTIAFIGGCGGGSKATPDAPTDAPPLPSNIDIVACAGGEQGPITTTDVVDAYMGSPLTITVGQTVSFVMSSAHNAVADVGGDPHLAVTFGETKCLKFKAAGTYSFHCSVHAFKGKVIVQ